MFGDLNDGKRKYRDSPVYLIFAKTFIPCIIPKKTWKTKGYEKRFCDYVTASDEAFMIWAFTNYNDWWWTKYQLSGEDDGDEKKRKIGEPLWTSGDKSMKDGCTEMGKGVTKKGLEIYWNIYEVILRERVRSSTMIS